MDKRQTLGFAFGAVMMLNTGARPQQAPTASSGTTITNAPPSSADQPLAAQAENDRIKPAKTSRRRRHKAEKSFLAGTQALEANDPDTAEKDFQCAHLLDPNNQRYPLSVEVARQYVVTQLMRQAEKERSLNHRDKSLLDVQQAMRLDPQNPIVIQFVDTLAADESASMPVISRGSAESAPPINLVPENGVHTFHLRTDKRSLISQVLNAYGIKATIGDSVNAQRIHFDADEVDFTEAADLAKLSTDTFFVPLDSLHVLVASDTKANRTKYEREAMETVYFPGLNATELTDMGNIARNIFGAEHNMVEASHGTMTIRAPEPELEALNETYAELLGGRSELQLEVEVYEIDKTKATNIGVILPSSTTVFNVPSEVNSILSNNASLVNELLASDPALAGNYEAILAALIASGALTGTVFNSPFAVFGGGITEMGLDLSGITVNMLLNSSDTRSLDHLEVRVLDQEDATIRSGERYPIMTASYSSLLGSLSSATGTVPQVQYEDLGLTLKVRPRIELAGEVSLNLDLKLSSLTGSSLNGIPILANRQYTGVISVHLGDSALIVSDLSKQESLEVTGIPGLSDIPGFSGTTNRQDTKDIMELAIMVTPHVVRLVHQEIAEPMLLLPLH